MSIKTGFLLDEVTLSLDKILPSRQLKPAVRSSSRYQMILASVREVGIIEPLIVYPEGKGGKYLLLDGHLRVEVLRELGLGEATCLVSTDDENWSYNDRVSRIAPIQENRMILKAIEEGVSEERIARTLGRSVRRIRESKTRLKDICPDAVEALKDKPIADMALRVLKKVKPYRQLEMAELMRMSNTYTASYAKALLASTPPDQRAEPEKVVAKPEQLAKLETEMRAVERDFVVLEESYSRDTLNLQLARGYLKTLLGNQRVTKYLAQKHAELLQQLQKVVEVTSLEA